LNSKIGIYSSLLTILSIIFIKKRNQKEGYRIVLRILQPLTNKIDHQIGNCK